MSSVRLSSGEHDNSNTHATLLTSEFCGFPESGEHVSCAHRQNHFQSCSMCLKCASSERDLSPPQMRRRYLQASCRLTRNYRRSTQLVACFRLSRTRCFSPWLERVTEHNVDQKYTTSWVMDDFHSQILHATQVSLRNIHPSHSIPTECKRHRCWSTVTGVHRLDHPPLASVCLNSCWLQSRHEFFGTRMDLELLPSA